MGLQVFWYITIAVLWTGFFVLEGFDFGVGILHDVVGRNDTERRVAINTIGPLWDGNEVWLIVAAAGMFAAFPGWYATMFSGFYLALVLLLVALIIRGVSFEYRGKRDSARWRGTWDVLMTAGSVAAPLLLGVALGNLIHGVPIGSNQEYTGTFADLLNPYSLFVGVTFVLLCVLHGSTFLALKTTGDIRTRANRIARTAAPVVALAVLVYAVWTHVMLHEGVLPGLLETVAVGAILSATWLGREGREGWAFTMTTVGMAATVLTIFIDLYPNVMISSTNPAYSLTVQNTASSPYALKVMTIVAVIFLPLVLLYQGWTYHVFRKRVSTSDLEPQGPADAPVEAAGVGTAGSSAGETAPAN